MPPKGRNVQRSVRYSQLLKDLAAQKEEAKKTLKSLRNVKKLEDRRHKRLLKGASKLDAKDLMELAGLKNITIGQLASFASEMGVSTDDAFGQGTSSSSGTRTGTAQEPSRENPSADDEAQQEHDPEP